MVGDLNPVSASGMGPGGYGPPPGGGYGPPGGGGYAPPPPPGGGGYGPPPPPGGGGYGPPPNPTVPAQPAQPMSAGQPPGPKKKAPVGLIIGIIAAIAVLGGGAAAAYWYFAGSGPVLAKYAPKDTQVYVEIPSVNRALAKLAATDIIDSKELDGDKQVEDMANGMATAFDISKDDAKSVIKSISGASVAVRDVSKKGQGAVIVSFSSNIDALMKSKRFSRDGELHGGTKYEIERKDIDPDKAKKMSTYEKMFSTMQVKGDENVLVYFESKKLLVGGDKDMVEDTTKVINGDKDSLATSETFKKAKWESGSVMLAYVDPEVVDDVDVRNDYLKDVGPFVGSMRIASAGMVTTLSGQLKGKKLPADNSIEDAVKLNLSDKLPADTVGYMAWSTKSKLTGKEAQEQVIKTMKEADKDKGKAFEKALDEIEKEYGISLETFFDAIGDQAIFAVTASEKIKLGKDLSKDDIIDNLGAVLAIQVKKKDAAEKLVKTLREEVVEKLGKDAFDVDKKDSGFVAKPKDDKLPTVKVTFEGDYLLFIIGKKERANAILSAFKGEDKTLKDDGAHKKAMSALNTKPHFLMWLDTGRFTKQVLDDKDLRDMLKEQEIPYKALKVEGDDRMTSAFALEVKASDGTWTYKVESLNLAGAGALAGFAGMARKVSGGGGGGFDTPSDPGGGGGGSGGSIGIVECDLYLAMADVCTSKFPPSARDGWKQGIDATQKAWKQALSSGPAAKDALRQSCSTMLDTLRQNPICK